MSICQAEDDPRRKKSRNVPYQVEKVWFGLVDQNSKKKDDRFCRSKNEIVQERELFETTIIHHDLASHFDHCTGDAQRLRR